MREGAGMPAPGTPSSQAGPRANAAQLRQWQQAPAQGHREGGKVAAAGAARRHARPVALPAPAALPRDVAELWG